MDKKTFASVDEYIENFSPEIQEKLTEIRKIIAQAAPMAAEKISWGMPTFYYNGNLVHFAGNKEHIGFYPGDSAIERFKDELTAFPHSKGAIKLMYKNSLPKQLITKIVEFRVKEQKLRGR